MSPSAVSTSTSTTRAPADAARLALLSCVVLALVHLAIVAFTPAWQRVPGMRLLTSAAVTVGPYALLAWALRGRPGSVTLGAARGLASIAGLAVVVLVVGGIVTVLGHVLFIYFPLLGLVALTALVVSRSMLALLGVIGVALLLLFAGVQRVLADAARRALSAKDADASAARRGYAMAVVYVLLLPPFAAMQSRSVMTANVDKMHASESRMRDEPMAARRALMSVQRALLARAATGGGYPASLAELTAGSGACSGGQCLADSLASGHLNGWTVTYVPGQPDSAKVIRTYRLSIVPPASYPQQSDALSTDESGVAYALLGAVKAPDPGRVVDSPAARMREFALCIAQERVTYNLDRFPDEITERAPNGSWGCLGPNAGPHSPRSRIRLRDGLVSDYEITYLPGAKDAQGRVTSFTIGARPATYAVTGLRSYLLDEAGTIHHTPEDRAATVNDPPVPGCELRPGETCPRP